MICSFCGMYYETEEAYCCSRCEQESKWEKALNAGNVSVYQIISSKELELLPQKGGDELERKVRS